MRAYSEIPFTGTKEQAEKLTAELELLQGKAGALMPALQKAQEIYGYLPYEVQLEISKALTIPMSEIYGVVTFYSQFNLSPKGKFQIGVCLGTACYVKGAGDLFDAFKDLLGIDNGECTEDGKFSLVATRCIGCCGLAPVLTVNEDVYGKITSKDAKDILAKYQA
ncbi:MAG: NAD(P)H-dependent oxidoreductase subunit E [Bacillota bacterium]